MTFFAVIAFDVAKGPSLTDPQNMPTEKSRNFLEKTTLYKLFHDTIHDHSCFQMINITQFGNYSGKHCFIMTYPRLKWMHFCKWGANIPNKVLTSALSLYFTGIYQIYELLSCLLKIEILYWVSITCTLCFKTVVWVYLEGYRPN